ncbi:hypothetical protein CRENBAI_001171 [Crenichthys baileyi]|uniref:Secreted protein n=1 Tax=Crenichthys baileyi TaxID=28760 RepID=A0AAV9RH04_9TELE
MTFLDFLDLLVELLLASTSCLSILSHHSPSGGTAHTAQQPVNLNFRGLLIFSRNSLLHLQCADPLRLDTCWILSQPVLSINLFKHYPCLRDCACARGVEPLDVARVKISRTSDAVDV